MSKHLSVGMVVLAIGTSGLVSGCVRVKIEDGELSVQTLGR